jgi:hypothetical protein
MTLREFLDVYNMYCLFAIYDSEDNVLGDKEDGLFQYKRDRSAIKDEWLDSEVIMIIPNFHNHTLSVDISLAYKETC